MLYEIQPGHEIEYFLRFYHILWIYKSLSFWQFSINSNQNTTLHTFNICFIRIWMDNNSPMYTLGDMAWTRGRIFLKFSLVFKVLSLSHFFIKSNETTTLHTFHWCFIRMWKNPLSTFGDMAWTRTRTDGQTEKLKPISPLSRGIITL